MALQIGKYKRPGIYVEEFDNSVISSPIVVGTATVVIGSSRKGKFNSPVLLNTINDLQNIYGNIDSNLERKGSYFHRTVAQMLQSGPVYAINLLNASDTLDTIEYQTVSTRSDKNNDIKRNGAYRKFFDTTGFWNRNTDSFISLVSGDANIDQRLLGFTNMSDKYVTLFIYKTQLTGYDTTLLQYYGSVDKIPTYLNQLDYASDYMVDVVIVAGDWSNYTQLSVDSIWSAYFTSDGLIKEQILNFINNRNVNLLSYYEGLSLIPYFRNLNGKNIFIETNINNDTDKTGVFCYFDADKLEAFFPDGMVDLIGNNILNTNKLVDNGQSSINFLSYEANITQNIEFDNVTLDIAGGSSGQNVWAIGPSMSSSLVGNYTWGGDQNKRTAYFSEGYINGVTQSGVSFTYSTINVMYDVESTNTSGFGSGTSSYTIIGGTKLLINSGVNGVATCSISSSIYPVSTTTASYGSVFYIDSSNGNISTKSSLTTSLPTLSTNDVVLGYITYSVYGGSFSSYLYTNVGVTNSSFGYNQIYKNSDYTVSTSGTKLTLTFLNTDASDVTNSYQRHRKIRLFNSLLNMLDSSNLSKMTMIKDVTTSEKLSLSGSTLVSYNTSTTSNKSLTLDLGVSVPTDVSNGNLVFYKTDNEFLIRNLGFNTRTTVATASYGIVAPYSDFYTDFYNGTINTGDYFYQNIIGSTYRVVFQTTSTHSYIVFNSSVPFDVNTSNISIPSSTLNTGNYTFFGDSDYHSNLVDPSTGITYTSGYKAYLVNGVNVVNEDLSNVSVIYDASQKIFLKMFTDNSGNLDVKYKDINLDSSISISSATNLGISVVSDIGNFKQTIEIVEPNGYTPVVNKILIDGTRYTEIVVGDFLEAYVDSSLLENGQQARNLTRITSKKLYTNDTSLVEITCDSAINKILVGGDLQTIRYVTIDKYVSTYQAIPLKGFRLREASLPDGTETQQSAILNLVAKGTPLFKAITNKDAIDFRYLIDSYGLGLIERSKQQLMDICGERKDCLGFLNMPSMKSFRKSTSPSFVNSDGILDTSFISQGGNPTSNPSFLYSFGDGIGASSVAYFCPYVTVSDNGRPTEVPPAMFVATTYMRKLNSNVTSVTPWTVAAGVTNGKVINISGVEMNFNPTDIENLNGAQMNPIIFKRNRGYVIETENTGLTLYRSSLSFIHVREVLIELEKELSNMLLDFQWKFNTSEIRAEVKLRADTICEKFVNKNGLYTYFNKCDEENNTPDVIDNQIGALDTYVEPIKAMGVFVNGVTVLRTGAIKSGGFQIQ